MNKIFIIVLFILCCSIFCKADIYYKTTLYIYKNDNTTDSIIITDGIKKGKMFLNDETIDIIDIDSIIHSYKRFKITKIDLNSVPTSITENIPISVFVNPNPTTNEIYLKGIEDEKVIIEMFSLTGELLFQKEIYSTDKIDISMLPVGSYFIRIKEHIINFIKN